MKRLPNLDALRFFLASLVILFHVPQLCRNQGLPFFDDLAIFHRGKEAVYMFFVLSGFLIVKFIYIEKQNGVFSISSFYMRRILRIFPLYYLIVFFGFVFYHLILPCLNIPFSNNYELSEGVLMTVFFLPNVFAVLHKPGGILEVLWSIGIEEQFYLLIAPFLFIIHKSKVFKALVALTIAYFVLYHLPIFEVLQTYSFVYFFLFFGGIVAIMEEKRLLEFMKRWQFIPIFILILTGCYFLTDLFQFEQVWIENLFTAMLFGFFIHTIAHNNLGIINRLPLLNYFGKISYGIYMYHVIVLNLVVFLFLKFNLSVKFNNYFTVVLINIFTFAITLLIAHLSYKYYESYFLKLKTKFRT